MIQTIIDKLQKLNDLPSTITGMYSYFAQNMNTYKQFMNNVAGILDGSVDASDTQYDNDIAVISCYSPQCKYITFDKVRVALSEMMSTNLSSDDVDVGYYDEDDMYHDDFSLSETIDYLRDNMSVTNALLATLGATSDVITGVKAEFSDALQLRMDALSVCENTQNAVKSGIVSLSQNVGTIDSSSIKFMVPSLLSIFGIYQSKAQLHDGVAATYDGVNPYNVIATDGLAKMADLGETICHTFENFCAGVGYTIWTIVDNVFIKFGKWVAKWVLNMIGVQNAFASLDNPGGDGTVSINYNYFYSRALGSWQLTYFDNAFAQIDSNAVTGFLPTGNLIIEKDGDSGYRLAFFPKVLNYKAIRTAFSKAFSGWDVYACLPYAVEASTGTNMLEGTSSFIYPDVSINDCMSLILDIFQNDDTFTVNEFASDAMLLEGVYWAKFLTVLIAKLYDIGLNQTTADWNDSTTFTNLISSARACQFTEWQYDPNVSVNSGGKHYFEPNNYEAMMVCCSLQETTSAFSTGYTGGAIYSGYNVTDVSSLLSFGLIDSFAILAKWCWAGSSLRYGQGVFLPYLTAAVSSKPSFYIPTDSDNVTIAMGFLNRAAISVGTVAVAVGAFSIFRALRQKSFALSAQAGSMSWKAAETGDAAIMSAAYKLNKRSALLSRLSFYAGDIATSSASQLSVKPLLTSAVSDIETNTTTQITKVGRKIDPNFE